LAWQGNKFYSCIAICREYTKLGTLQTKKNHFSFSWVFLPGVCPKERRGCKWVELPGFPYPKSNKRETWPGTPAKKRSRSPAPAREERKLR
jgi:hypothetical protein